jgi:hypothetical protein
MQQLFPAEGEREPKLRFKAFSGEWELECGYFFVLCFYKSIKRGEARGDFLLFFWDWNIKILSLFSYFYKSYKSSLSFADMYLSPW